MPKTVYEKTIDQLAGAGIDSPRLEARLLIGYVKATDPNLISSSTSLNEAEQASLEKILEARLKHKPLDKILGHKDFYKYRFKVTEDVLTPRPDTEILVETAVKICREYQMKNLLDLGTGSGCILCSVLKECSEMDGTGVDQSVKALAVAAENAKHMQIEARCRWVCADWFDVDFENKAGRGFDMIVSNPPYIPTKDIATLEPEVKNHDPLKALDGGADGFDSYRKIAGLAGGMLTKHGFVLLEAGCNQAAQIVDIFEQQGFKNVDIIKDLAGIQRCIIFRKKDCN